MAQQINATKYSVKENSIKRDKVDKVSVKEMRKKFEGPFNGNATTRKTSNLTYFSNNSSKNKDDFQSDETMPSKKYLQLKPLDEFEDNFSNFYDSQIASSHKDSAPKPPLRRNRKNVSVNKMEDVNKLSKFNNLASDINYNVVAKSSNRMTIPNKLQLRELEHENEDINLNAKVKRLNISFERNIPQGLSSSPQPPIKPPRTPIVPNSNLVHYHELTSPSMIKEEHVKMLAELSRNSSNDFEETLETDRSLRNFRNSLGRRPALRLSPRFSVPEIYFNDIKVDSTPKKNVPVSKPTKLSIYSYKKKVFKDYVKNMSTIAQNIHEMVRGKQNITFDNFRTKVVLPSQKYGTLKKSFSDEHIYAEPFPSIPVMNHNGKSCSNADSLHYMCTPVLHSKFDKGNPVAGNDFGVLNQASGNVKQSKASLRKIIYESFSMLRKIPEDDENVKENQSGDSESDVSVKDVEERITYVKSIKKQMSTSSICIAPKLFDAILILTIAENGPEVLFKQSKAQTPFDYPLIQHLCFPDYKIIRKREVYTSEWFYFTLIQGDDEKFYGYCHRILGWSEEKRGFCRKLPVAICIVSTISAPLFYKKILNEIEKHLMLPSNKCIEYLASLQKLGVPNAGASLSIPDDKRETVILRPFDSHTVGMELTRSLQLLDVNVLSKTIASLLLERRVLLLSSNSEDLLHCVTSVASLLYPFQWQHLLIPIVPTCLSVQCCIESPYLLGIVSNNHKDILDLLGEQNVYVVDVDKGSVLRCFGDEDTILPKKVQKAVICALNLAKNMTDPREMTRDIMISEASVHMFVELIGHCYKHFDEVNGTFVFQKEAFQKGGSSRNIQSFLKWFSETQMFEAFIEECIWRKTYRDICQSQLTTFFEKRIEEYNWELTYNNEKITRKIVKRVQDFGEKLKGFKKT